jgi:predicted dienelactone hydrolase
MLWALLACMEPVDGLALEPARTARVTVVDGERGHAASVGLEASDVRELPLIIWLPASSAPAPVLLLAHGNSGHPDFFAPLAQGLSDDGWVVVAPVFPVTNHYGDTAGLGVADLIEQPADLDVVMAALVEHAVDPRSPLVGRLDLDRVAAAGHSLGGATVGAWTRWIEPGRDDLAGVILVSAALFLNVAFGEGPRPEGPPTLLIHGAADGTIPPSNSADFYAAVDGPVAWVEMPTAEHADLIEGDGPLVPQTRALFTGALNTWFLGDEAAWGDALDVAAARGDMVSERGAR